MDQARYATSVVGNYLCTVTIKENSKFHNTTLPHDMIFTKEILLPVMNNYLYSTNSLQSLCGIIGFLLSARVNLCFAVHKLSKFSSNPVKFILRVLYTCLDIQGTTRM